MRVRLALRLVGAFAFAVAVAASAQTSSPKDSEDPAKTLHRLRLAAQEGDALSSYALARQYADADQTGDLPPDYRMALMWMGIAINQDLQQKLDENGAVELMAFAEALVSKFNGDERNQIIDITQRCWQAKLKGCEIEAAEPRRSVTAPGEVSGLLSLSDKQLETGTAYDCYALQTVKGDGYRVRVSSEDFDTFVAIASSCEGTPSFSNDDGPDAGKYFDDGNSMLDFDATANQVYLRVQSANRRGLGRYSLDVSHAYWQGVATTADFSRLVSTVNKPSRRAAEQSLHAQCRELGSTCEIIAISLEKCIGVSWLPGRHRYDAATHESDMEAKFDAFQACGSESCEFRSFCPSYH